MANAPDTLPVTGPVFQQVAGDAILVTPAGGTQDTARQPSERRYGISRWNSLGRSCC